MFVAHNAIEPQDYRPENLDNFMSKLFQRYAVTENTKLIIFLGRKIEYKGDILTAGKLKSVIEGQATMLNLGFPKSTVVSSGSLAADPHYRGKPNDKIKPNTTIVIDIFPQHLGTGYCGDITRTLFKGKPKLEVELNYMAVLEAQETEATAGKVFQRHSR